MKCTKYLHKISAHKLEVWCRKTIFHKDETKDELAIRNFFRDVLMTATAGNPRTVKELNSASLVFQVRYFYQNLTETEMVQQVFTKFSNIRCHRINMCSVVIEFYMLQKKGQTEGQSF